MDFCSVFAGCQIPYPKREFLTEEEPDDKGDKVGIKLRLMTKQVHLEFFPSCTVLYLPMIWRIRLVLIVLFKII